MVVSTKPTSAESALSSVQYDVLQCLQKNGQQKRGMAVQEISMLTTLSGDDVFTALKELKAMRFVVADEDNSYLITATGRQTYDKNTDSTSYQTVDNIRFLMSHKRDLTQVQEDQIAKIVSDIKESAKGAERK